MRTWIAGLLFVLACRGSTEPARKPTGSASPPPPAASAGSAAADPWSQPAAAKPVTPEDRKKRAEAAIARVATVQPKLASVRGLPLDKPVVAELQSADDFRAFVQRELAKELPKDKAEKLQAAGLHVGLFTKPVDVVKMLEQAATTQAAAYYDPATKKFFVVMAPDNDMMFDTISAHELTHAVQDAHFDLAAFMPTTLDDDASFARRFLVEGDATFAMIVYAASDATGGKRLEGAMLNVMKTQIARMADMTIAEFGSTMKQQADALVGDDAALKRSMESVGELPPLIIKPMIDSYMKGAVVAMTAYEQGGWKAVDALYKAPPTSSEQVLHPAEKLVGRREEPKKVALPALPKGVELANNVWGELQWSIYFEQWGVKDRDAAPGWGGDRYAVIKRDDGSTIAFIATTWDTAKDAQEFHDAYVASLGARFPGSDTTKPAAGVARSDRGKVFVKLVGTQVWIVDGADEPRQLDQLVNGTRIK